MVGKRRLDDVQNRLVPDHPLLYLILPQTELPLMARLRRRRTVRYRSRQRRLVIGTQFFKFLMEVMNKNASIVILIVHNAQWALNVELTSRRPCHMDVISGQKSNVNII